ncbi:MAG: GC-type dockerin domain-anchored protein [Phycisphaerales bacterium]
MCSACRTTPTPRRRETTVAHTGSRCISISAVGAGAFHGYTTDTQDALPPNFTFLFYDVPVDWRKGDIHGSIWYMIPADQSLGNPPTPNWPVDAPTPFAWPDAFAPAALKFEVKGAGNGNQNNASYDGWSFGFARNVKARDSLIWGDTNGQWRQLSFTWPAHATDGSGWKDQTYAASIPNPDATPPYPGYSLPPEGTWPNPPAGSPRWPDRCKITIGRWNPSSTAAGGKVYLDDVSFTQDDAAPAQCGRADIGSTGGQPGPDNALDNNDFIVFITYFFNHNVIADMGTTGGIPGNDGAFDNNDFIAFINYFFAGCNH